MPVTKCVIGVGSPHGDDQAGWLIADALKRRNDHKFAVHSVGSPMEILDHLEGVNWLGICDACLGLDPDVGWQCWNWPDERMIKPRFAGSHDIGLPAVLELAARLGRLPETVMIWGVAIEKCRPGDAVSDRLMTLVPEIVDVIAQSLPSSD
ncbi:MAG: hydrogenase maturation protease [Planctomycetaceae bacterium]|nr:hydrogenase maturation protease [Planctomycetaceae bacterium]